jgi:hypothetical protein
VKGVLFPAAPGSVFLPGLFKGSHGESSLCEGSTRDNNFPIRFMMTLSPDIKILHAIWCGFGVYAPVQ